MQPGLARAVPSGIVGFAGGALLAILIRLAQGLDPNPAAPYAFVGPAFVLGAFISAGVFVWGMGAFDPKMSVHGEHAEQALAKPEPETPSQILSGYTWQILTWTTVLILVVAIFAFLPSGPQLRSVSGDGNPSAIGYTTAEQIYQPVREFADKAAGIKMPALADNLAAVQISYLVLFVFFVLWTIVTLFVVSGLLAFVFSYLATARKKPDAIGVPWRAIVLIAIIGGLVNFPIISPKLDVPMAFIVPAYLIPPLMFLIAYRNPVWAILLLGGLTLPVLVPSVNLSGVWIVYNLLLALILEMLFLRALKFLIGDSLWRTLSLLVYEVTIIGAFLLTLATAWPDFWQIVFLLVVELGVVMLLLPVDVLKRLVPAGMWAKFAAVKWLRVVPEFAGWLAGLLRDGLPKLLGQR
ncbi:MAG: hypothetical protein ABI690_12595 [Chloroflexota bacterium]